MGRGRIPGENRFGDANSGAFGDELADANRDFGTSVTVSDTDPNCDGASECNIDPHCDRAGNSDADRSCTW